jgi:hypothetical protein
MGITNIQSGTRVDEIAAGIYRISTPVPPSDMPGGFTFNQILIAGSEPLLFHTGQRRLFPVVSEAVAHLLGDLTKLRFVSFSHVEADECGSLNLWLAAAPNAQPVCGKIGALVSVNDLADRAPLALGDGEELALGDGEELALGSHRVRWLDAPNLPHNWECGYLFESTTRTLLCGDLFTHAGHELPALTRADVVGPAEAMRAAMPDSVAIDRNARGVVEKLARTEPTTLALMHGSSFAGDGRAALLSLAEALGV